MQRIQRLIGLGGAALMITALVLGGCTRANPYHHEAAADGPRLDLGVGGDGPLVAEGPPPDDGPPPDQEPPPPARPNAIDLLLVIDDSAHMGYAQQWLSSDLTSFINQLKALPGGASVRIGVVSTDMGVGPYATGHCSYHGDAGELQISAKCDQPAGGVSFIQQIGSTLNVSSPIEQVVGCAVRNIGEDGCGFEQPLEAMRAALDGANPKFLRPEAALAVIILSNEDDCSAQSTSLYDPADQTLGSYSSYRCFRYGVLCDGVQPPLAPTVLSNCTPAKSWLHPVKTRYADFLVQLKPEGWVSLLVLAAPPTAIVEVITDVTGDPQVRPTCNRQTRLTAQPAFRLGQLADQLGAYGAFASICGTSYKSALQGLLLKIQSAF
jgi:hypothetical protein